MKKKLKICLLLALRQVKYIGHLLRRAFHDLSYSKLSWSRRIWAITLFLFISIAILYFTGWVFTQPILGKSFSFVTMTIILFLSHMLNNIVITGHITNSMHSMHSIRSRALVWYSKKLSPCNNNIVEYSNIILVMIWENEWSFIDLICIL